MLLTCSLEHSVQNLLLIIPHPALLQMTTLLEHRMANIVLYIALRPRPRNMREESECGCETSVAPDDRSATPRNEFPLPLRPTSGRSLCSSFWLALCRRNEYHEGNHRILRTLLAAMEVRDNHLQQLAAKDLRCWCFFENLADCDADLEQHDTGKAWT